MSRSIRGVYPGTFDPPTRGHLDIIARALHVVDELVIGIATNAGKEPMFTLEERVAMVDEAIAELGGEAREQVQIKPFDNLLVHFAAACGASVIIRGLRAVTDFEYEFQMTGMNARLDPTVETVFLMATEKHQFIASKLVKEIALLGGDIAPFVSPRVAKRLLARVARDG